MSDDDGAQDRRPHVSGDVAPRYDVPGLLGASVVRPAVQLSAVRSSRAASPGAAAALSLLLPGLGHLYAGRRRTGVLVVTTWVAVTVLALAASLPLLVMWVLAALPASLWAYAAASPVA